MCGWVCDGGSIPAPVPVAVAVAVVGDVEAGGKGGLVFGPFLGL